jgi:malonate-semialdehyde dehydrogenase (acetylating)/methylmalonate-semialdehyde dehydrogenase
MVSLAALIRAHTPAIAACITAEQGKTLADARGDVFRGLEVVESAAGVATALLGDFAESVSAGIDTYSVRQPLGVCAGICPFNFPAMARLLVFCAFCHVSAEIALLFRRFRCGCSRWRRRPATRLS